MGKVAQLWNPRGNQTLRRHWVAFEDQIVIGGETQEQSGVLSVRPVRQGELRARLRVMGREYEEAVCAGHDIAIWINGLQLFVGVKAVDDEHMLVAFGIPQGSTVNVTLDHGAGVDDDAADYPAAVMGNSSGRSIGLCQTQS